MKYLILFSVIFTFLSCSKFDSTKINCTEDKECPNNHICYKSQCHACALDEYFNDEKGKCVNYCEENATLCGGQTSPSNEEETQTCIGGRVNVKTKEKDYRNTPAYRCECQSGYVLMGTECKKDAKCPSILCTNSTCSENYVCHNGFCKQKCSDDIICNTHIGETCQNGHCSIIDCSDNEICYNGGCFPKNECSLMNPMGDCPSFLLSGSQFVCDNGQCVIEVAESDDLKEKGDICSFKSQNCKQGFFCIKANLVTNDDDTGVCSSFCDLRYNNCSDEDECLPFSMIKDASFNYSNTAVYQNIGVCYQRNCQVDSNCENTGGKCKYFTDNLSICMPNQGDRVENSLCSNNKIEINYRDYSAFCKDDLVCIDNHCMNLCDVDEQDCPPDSLCLAAMNEYSGQFNRQIGACFKNCQLILNNTEESYYYIGRDLDDCKSGICVSLDTNEENGFCNMSSCNGDEDCIEGQVCTLSPDLVKYCKKITPNKQMGDFCNPEEENYFKTSCGLNMVCEKIDKTNGVCVEYCIPLNDNNNKCSNGYNCIDYKLFNKSENIYKIAPKTMGFCSESKINGLCEFSNSSSFLIERNTTCDNGNGVCSREKNEDNEGICSVNGCILTNTCEDGKTCSLISPGVKECKTLGNKEAGKSCKKSSDCGLNMFCNIQNNQIYGTCLEFCEPLKPESCSFGECIDIVEIKKDEIQPGILGVCQESCTFESSESQYNLVSNDSCKDEILGELGVCSRVNQSNIGVCTINACSDDSDCGTGAKCSLNYLGLKSCKPEGTKTTGQSCINDGDCKNNMVCDDSNPDSKTCLELCKPNQNTCSIGTCVDISTIEGNPSKFESGIIGICTPSNKK